MDITPAILIFTPIFLPIAQHLGIDPIHFGIIMVFNLTIGLCTPPVGTILFVGCSIGKVSIDRAIKPLMPMFLALFVVMAMICYFPQLSLMLRDYFRTDSNVECLKWAGYIARPTLIIVLLRLYDSMAITCSQLTTPVLIEEVLPA